MFGWSTIALGISPHSSWVKKCMEYEVEGSRARGRPNRTGERLCMCRELLGLFIRLYILNCIAAPSQHWLDVASASQHWLDVASASQHWLDVASAVTDGVLSSLLSVSQSICLSQS